jgi:membrane-associated phospholipid phosphatase
MTALLTFAIALVGVTLGAALGWRAPARRDPTTSSAWLAYRAFVSAVLAGCAAVFAGAALALRDAGPTARLDTVVAAAVGTDLPPAALAAFSRVTRLGDVAFLVVLGIVVGVILLLRRRFTLAGAWISALGGNGLINPALKEAFARARPDPALHVVPAEGFSFPSGHSSGSVVAYGMLAYVLMRTLPPRWHPGIVVTAAAIAFTIGCSRAFVQVHYASDILGGFASGLTWLTVCIIGAEAMRRRFGRRTEVS